MNVPSSSRFTETLRICWPAVQRIDGAGVDADAHGDARALRRLDDA